MRKALTMPLSVLVLAVALAGCSKKQNAETTDAGQIQVAAQDSAQLSAAQDSLAAKRYPTRDETNPFVTIVTDLGDMTVELYRDVAPGHVDSFLARTREGFYDGTIFHRVIDQFMIQGGDPKGTGTGNAGYFLKAEFSDLPHQEGTLSMARSRDPNSASCQFFICLARNRMTMSLDRQYTIFGQLIKGFHVLHKIGSVECVPNPFNPSETSKPKEDIYLRKLYVSDAEGGEIR